MYAHHRQTIERMKHRFQADPNILALIIIGSVARGDAHERSDVEGCLVATDAVFQRRSVGGATSFTADDLCDYPDGHAGGGLVDLAFLYDMAARGPEPARFAFKDAIIAFSRVSQLEQTVAQIPRYPEYERTEKMVSFISQLPVHFSYMELAEYSQNPYLLAQTAVELVLFGGRLILAHNRMLYPNRKLFLREFDRAPDKPAGIIALAKHLLTQPGIQPASKFCDAIRQFQDWPQPPEGHMARFQKDRDQHWRWGIAPLADR